MCLVCFGRMQYCFFDLVVSTSAINSLGILVYEMTNYVSSGMLNPTHPLTDLIQVNVENAC